MPYTRQQLVNRALANLGALPVGQTASSQEYASVDNLVDATLQNLSGRDIFDVEDVAAIDDAAFIPLGHCLAWNCAPEFGLHSDTALAALNQQAEAHLKSIQSESPTYKTLEIVAW